MVAKLIHYRRVSLKSIVVPGSFSMATRIESPHIQELAASMRTIQVHPVSLRKHEDGSLHLVAGGDRYAAHVVAKLSQIWAGVWECESDRDELELHLIENAYRRHCADERAEVQQRLIDLYSEDVKAEGLPPELQKAAIRERVASAMGIKPKTVDRAERARKDRVERPAPNLTTPPILTHGISLSGDWHAGVVELHGFMADAVKGLRRAQQLLARAARHPYARQGELVRMHQEVTKVTTTVRMGVPKSICPYCKALDGVMDDCGPCAGTALVSVEQWDAAPKELTEDMGPDGLVYYKGKKFTASEWLSLHRREPEPEDGEAPIEADPLDELG